MRKLSATPTTAARETRCSELSNKAALEPQKRRQEAKLNPAKRGPGHRGKRLRRTHDRGPKRDTGGGGGASGTGGEHCGELGVVLDWRME